MVTSQAFGPMVAGAARQRRFAEAERRAFVADGQAYNGSIQERYFADYEPIADFLHVLCYLYLAAWGVGSTEVEKWRIYEGWLRECWQGRVEEVSAELAIWQGRVGEPPPGKEGEEKEEHRWVVEAKRYLTNNQSHMLYPRYRQQGLPATSSLVESLVGEFNARVKSREKFWNRPEGAEAILQLRAAVLSEDGRLADYFAQRL